MFIGGLDRVNYESSLEKEKEEKEGFTDISSEDTVNGIRYNHIGTLLI